MCVGSSSTDGTRYHCERMIIVIHKKNKLNDMEKGKNDNSLRKRATIQSDKQTIIKRLLIIKT